ncbi:occludin-like [Sinocyclocheilus anshuiensis]|uniref:Occludin n=1 Tax=Sinocyclocheilus anshuiensis TaxID=1608454 RepID=A0A671MJH2_9TELE|nr:PREDICTED: occludin-like [Sinocyclocheilus anshuiensis]
MSSRPNGSPPPYDYHTEDGYNVAPQPAYSYYPDEEFQHFYRWTSPPGIIKIMSVMSIIFCVGIFVCVASTLAWDTDAGAAGFGGYGGSYGGGSYGSYGGGGSYGSYGMGGYGMGGSGGYGGYGYGILGSQNDPRQGKGFMIAMAIITFIILLVIFIMIISHQKVAQGRKFYLAVIIISAIMAFLMLVATIVYLVTVYPMAQSSGSVQFNQVYAMCAAYQQPQMTGGFVNQYLYHYCVVDPQEAIALVLGFIVTAALIIIMVFAIKTRQKINHHGKDNILWRHVKEIGDQNSPQDVEDWVNDVNGVPEPLLADYPMKAGGSRNDLDDNSTNYDKPPYSESPVEIEHNVPIRSSVPLSSGSEMNSSAGRPKKRRAGRPRTADGRDHDTDYASSGDELDDDDFSSEFPPIINNEEREHYKRLFDEDHQAYKELQAEMDQINKRLAEVDRELDDLQEGSPQFLDAMDEYNSLKDKKRSGDYLLKKKRCKHLKAKLSHIKRMVSDYDRRS